MTRADLDAPPEHRPDPAIIEFVRRSGLLPPGMAARLEFLPGGVSSDIWVVRAASAVFCVKRALPRLRVAADWRAPIERNAKEAAWIKAVAGFHAGGRSRLCWPRMPAPECSRWSILPPQSFEVWKAQLQRGHVAPTDRRRSWPPAGRAFTAGSRDPRRPRPSLRPTRSFNAIRLEPYLLATARAHPDRAAALETLAETTARTKLTLVHGDVSPKNILVGPQGPVFIDAECAWFGDPAFDLAFCLNHLLLKCLWVPAAASQLLGGL